ncbi:MAG: zonular occludens toxin domain-containing protein [Sulfurihydrogenibium sp.]|jgi:zona occludens toxin (predicted ATPase)|nr:zonular occludens toxin domain-containing protein [Sulfurihydrogenibium sp.]
MLQIIYGVPGSGKSYYAVYNIKKFLEKEKNINLISNIENLKLPHEDLDKLIQDYGGVDKFFNVDCEFWKKDIEIKKILFVDESQRYFNKRFFSSSVFFFFQYHRHLNCDIYLITQSYKTLPTELVVLSEIVIQAVPSSFRWFKNSFKYLVKDLETFETVEKIDIPFKKDVAELYTSALVINTTKKMTYTQKYLIGSVLLFSVALLLLIFAFPYFFLHVAKSDDKKVASQTKQVNKSSSTNSSNLSLPKLEKKNNDDKGFEYPGGIATKGYRQKEITYGEYLNKYQNGVVYQSVNHIIVYDNHNRPKKVFLYKEDQSQNSDNSSNNLN